MTHSFYQTRRYFLIMMNKYRIKLKKTDKIFIGIEAENKKDALEQACLILDAEHIKEVEIRNGKYY